MRRIVVVIGAGGIGEAIARQLGPGREIMLASRTEVRLEAAAQRLRAEGNVVHTKIVDVVNREMVKALVAAAGELGPLDAVVHTGGLSPSMASPAEILRVNLLGTAIVLDEFIRIAETDTVAVCVASSAGYAMELSPEFERALATSPTDQLLSLPEVAKSSVDAQSAYMVAKRGNQLRVQGAANAWGSKGARVISVSPGVVATPMGDLELSGPTGELIHQMIENTGVRRIGTPTDISAAVGFLISPAASFLTGADLLIDGGFMAGFLTGAPAGPPVESK